MQNRILSVSLVVLSFLLVGVVLLTRTNLLPKQGEGQTQIVKSHSKKEEVRFPSYTKTIKEQLGDMHVVNNPTSMLVLVNKNRKLPDFYAPPDLVIPKVRFSYEGDKEKMKMRKEAAKALQKLFQAADKDRIYLFAVSAYRSFERQSALHAMYKKKEGEAVAATYSAVPGTSEHQTGLAVDVTSQSVKFKLQPSFGNTKEGKWLAKHAHEYGFILRYPKDKTKITGYSYEPWHIRYVGNPHATYLYRNDLTLEEAMK
jgi:D-alanyl-D-alanine carboxypeptidase